jgi:hypothetical protein
MYFPSRIIEAMSPLRPQMHRLLSRIGPARPHRWLLALLAATLPGALLICILHCTLPLYAHHHHSHGASPFVCSHAIAEPGDLVAPLSESLVQSVVQGLTAAGLVVAAALIVLHGAVATLAAWASRPGEGPPIPPPRRAA